MKPATQLGLASATRTRALHAGTKKRATQRKRGPLARAYAEKPYQLIDGALVCYLHLVTVSGDNQREHWGAKAKRAQQHRETARMVVLTAGRLLMPPWPPFAERITVEGDRMLIDASAARVELVVRMTRIAPRTLDDDGLRSALKSTRDGIADALGLRADNDPRVRWDYGQERGRVREYAVRVEVTSV